MVIDYNAYPFSCYRVVHHLEVYVLGGISGFHLGIFEGCNGMEFVVLELIILRLHLRVIKHS
jgi:hypothetical protein